MFDNLVGKVGFGWTLRIIAFLFLGLMLIAIFTVRSRLKHQPKRVSLAEFYKPFFELPFALHALGSLVFFWAYFVPPNFIVVYAQRRGMSARLAGYQPAILNAARYEFPMLFMSGHQLLPTKLTLIQHPGPNLACMGGRPAWAI